MLLWHRGAQFFKNSHHCPRSWLSCDRVQMVGHFQGRPCSRLLVEHCPDLRAHVRGHGWKPVKKTKFKVANLLLILVQFSSVQSLSHVRLFVIPRIAACQASLSITSSWSLLKLMSIKLLMPSNRLILCLPLLLPPSVLPSIRVFSNGSVLRIRWPKYWSFSFNISPSNEYSGLTSFRIDWFDLFAVQGTQESSLTSQFKSIILWHSAFFIVQLSHPYMTTGKAIALTKWIFVGKLISAF